MKSGGRYLWNELKLLLVACGVVLGLSAIVLAFHIWQSTPFFNMDLVFIDAVLVLLTATSLAIAMLSPCDRKTS